jgi:hypothetical protein
MEINPRQPATYDLFLALVQLQQRAIAPTGDDYAKLLSDVGTLISNVGHLFPGDSEARSSLGIAEVLLSLGRPADALLKVRALLIQRGG